MTTNQNIFDSLVGIVGVGTPSDTVNTLNGITDNAVAFLTYENGGTKADMFNKIKSQAYELLESELIGGLSTYKDFSSLIDKTNKVNISTQVNPVLYTADGLSYVGCTVQINRTPDKTKTTINGIDFVSDSSFLTNIKIFNLRTGLEEYTAGMAVTAGVNEFVITKELNFNFGSGLYFIGFLPPATAKFSRLTQEGNSAFIVQSSGTILLSIAKGINNVIETIPYFNVLASVEYAYTKIIEDNKELLATAFKYACGAVMLDRICVSKQADKETLINREAQEALALAYREDAIRFIKNARNEIYSKLNKVGSLKPIEKKVQIYSLGSLV